MRWFRKIKKEFREFGQATKVPPEGAKRYKNFKELKNDFLAFLRRLRIKKATLNDVFILSFICFFLIGILSTILKFNIAPLLKIAVVSILVLGVFPMVFGLLFRERTSSNIALAISDGIGVMVMFLSIWVFYKISGIAWWDKNSPFYSRYVWVIDFGWCILILSGLIGAVSGLITYIITKSYLRKRILK